jgi:ACS family pantothenate transporter-like MFS transporter
MAILTRIRDYVHHPYEHEGEGKLVRKIGKSNYLRCATCSPKHTDFFILTFCCMSYFTNYLDRSNLANAYVSGMKEELGFQGNQFNRINTVFTIGSAESNILSANSSSNTLQLCHWSSTK